MQTDIGIAACQAQEKNSFSWKIIKPVLRPDSSRVGFKNKIPLKPKLMNGLDSSRVGFKIKIPLKAPTVE